MSPLPLVGRRPWRFLMLVVAVVLGGVFSLYAMRVDIPALHTTEVYAALDRAGVFAKQAKTRIAGMFGWGAAHKEEAEEQREIIVTSPELKDVTLSKKYVCQIHSQRHINVCALESGYLEQIAVKEGQAVKKNDLLFKVLPILYEAKLASKKAEAKLADLEYQYTKKLADQKVVSQNEAALILAKLTRANAEAKLAEAELNFTYIRAPFDGIVDRQQEQLGSLIKEGDVLTTLSDNSVMWVYFNVPEADYLEYMADLAENKANDEVELVLADGTTFKHQGKIGAIEAKFNNETGNIPFRADFPNPERILRHGQTGTVVLKRVLKDAVVIPQRATFETLAKKYVYVITAADDDDDDNDDANDDKDDGHDRDDDDDDDDDDDMDDDDAPKVVASHSVGHGVVRQRDIVIQNELDDIYLIKEGLDVHDRIILEGIRQVRDGEKVKYIYRTPEEVLAHLKYHAE